MISQERCIQDQNRFYSLSLSLLLSSRKVWNRCSVKQRKTAPARDRLWCADRHFTHVWKSVCAFCLPWCHLSARNSTRGYHDDDHRVIPPASLSHPTLTQRRWENKRVMRAVLKKNWLSWRKILWMMKLKFICQWCSLFVSVSPYIFLGFVAVLLEQWGGRPGHGVHNDCGQDHPVTEGRLQPDQDQSWL